MSEAVTFLLPSTNDHTSKVTMLPNDNPSPYNVKQPPPPQNRPHPRPTSKHSTHPSHSETTTIHQDAKWGRMPKNDTNHPPSRPTNDNGRPQTLTTTPSPPCSIDNGHYHPQATSVTTNYEQQTPQRQEKDHPQPRKGYR